MRGRPVVAAIVAVGLLSGAVACGSGNAAVFRPGGSLSPQPGQAAPTPAAGGERIDGFTFPAGVSIDFTSPAPADAVGRAVVTGYQDYVLSMWAGVVTHGKNTAYTSHAAGDALTFVSHEVSRYGWRGRTVKGTIRYSATRVSAVYSGTGASVLSCVDGSAFHDVNTRTGASVGTAMPGRPARYLETVAEGRRSNGTWFVIRSITYPASSTQGAMCR